MGGSESLLSKNEWECVIFLEKWVGASRFCQKMSGSVLFFLENGWEWVRVVGSDWE